MTTGWGHGRRIAISCVSARPEPAAGIGRYVEGLLAGLAATDYQGAVTLFLTAGSPVPRLYLDDGQVDLEWFKPGRTPLYCLVWHLSALRRRARECGADLLHVTNLKPIAGGQMPTVLTVHDSAELVVAGRFDFARTFYRRRVFYPLARRAGLILTVSESARRPVGQALRLPPSSIRVVPNVVDLDRFRPDAEMAQSDLLRSRFLLYVGRIEHPNKNLVGLIRGFAQVHGSHPEVSLVIAGAPSWRAHEVIREARRTAGVTYLGYVAEEMLPGLFAAADLFVLPSFHEGFGIPVLEAMASGTPVAAARTGALPEVAGDAAVFFDPYDPQDIARILASVISDRALRDELIARGRERVRLYTALMVGEAMRDVYESLLRGEPRRAADHPVAVA